MPYLSLVEHPSFFFDSSPASEAGVMQCTSLHEREEAFLSKGGFVSCVLRSLTHLVGPHEHLGFQASCLVEVGVLWTEGR